MAGHSALLQAKVSEQEAARLDKDLTPVGAVRLGNSAGTIPAWTGGLTTPPKGYNEGDHHIDPYASEQPSFKIDKTNVDKFKDNLTPGQIALINQYAPGYFLNVYPTHRSAAYPEHIYQKLKDNAVKAQLLELGNGVSNTIATSPFPIPANGLEVLWNHILRYRGEQVEFRSAFVTPTPDGSYTPVLTEYNYFFAYSEPGAQLSDIDNKIFYLQTNVISPTKLAGTLNLVHETLDQVRSPRKAWRYQAGERRLRRAPSLEYGTDFPNSSSLKTVDQTDMYNGAPNQYEWTLTGKKEIYIPYNSYKLENPDLKIENIIQPKHINQDLGRYELHRVWVVEGVLRDGIKHPYHFRRMYFDEDSWQIVLTEEYDEDKKLWRVSEAHSITYYEKPLLWSGLEVTYDLKSRRYFADGLNNEEKPYNFNPGFDAKDFSTSAARRAAKR